LPIDYYAPGQKNVAASWVSMPPFDHSTQRERAPCVAVIGGGATGCAVARDLALRGLRVTLIEAGDLATGTSSRFHGMLQSGARYAVSDPAYAAECMRERLIVAELAPFAVETLGGLFVALREDPTDFPDLFLEGCRKAAIPVEELDPAEIMRAEPHLSREIQRAFRVPDATINPWQLTNALATDIEANGGVVLRRHRLLSIKTANGRVIGMEVEGGGGRREIPVDAIVNAGGPWSREIASLVGQSVALQLTKGSILVLAHRMVSKVVNRCRPPSSHDIIVPTGTVSLFGTTSEVVEDPGTTYVRPEEVQQLLDGAAPLIPGIRSFRALRVWAGVRPLVKPDFWESNQPLPRRHQVVDHSAHGVSGFITVCGGSLTTHRAMAADAGDHLCRQLEWNTPSTTATTPLIGAQRTAWRPAAVHERSEQAHSFAKQVCECEAVQPEEVGRLLSGDAGIRLEDLRRRLRLGFGPCQGTFCAPRAAELLTLLQPAADSVGELEAFWRERLKGIAPVAWGVQARQLLLNDCIYGRTLGLRITDGADV
jgi:glycerol-3-phosphate dehydrogenase